MFSLLLLTRRSVQRRPLHALYQYHIQHRSFHISYPRYNCASQEVQSQVRTTRKACHIDSASSPDSTSAVNRDESPLTDHVLRKSKNQSHTSDDHLEAGQPLHKDTPGPAIILPGPQSPLWTQATLETWRAAQNAGGNIKAPTKKTTRRMRAEANRAQRAAVKEEEQARITQRKEERARKLEAKVQALNEEKEARERRLEEAAKKRQEAEIRRQEEVIIRRKEAERIAHQNKEKQLHLIATEKAEKKVRMIAKKTAELEEKERRREVVKKKKQAAADAKRDAELPPKDVDKYLAWAFARADRTGRKADKRRINITSQCLANDALDRLKSSLGKHKGCDIVDINPGTGVWSATLHDYLKPRKHILLEPDVELYSPHLKPLLDAPDSNYTLIPKSGIVWRYLEDVLTETHLPFQKALKAGDPQLEQPNDTLLLVASLGYFPRVRFRGFASFSQLVIHQLVESVRTHTLLQKYGQVRMLIWIGDIEARKVLPKIISHRKKSSVDAEISCDIREIASSTALSSRLDSGFTASNTLEVMDRMAAAEITVSPRRESDAIQLVKRGVPDAGIRKRAGEPSASENEVVEEADKSTSDVKNKNMVNHTFHARLKRLEEDFQNGVFKENIDLPPSPFEAGHRKTEGLRWTPEYALLQLCRRQHRSGRILNGFRQGMAEETVTIMGLERENFLSPQGAEQEKIKDEIIARGNTLLDRIDDTEPHVMKDYLAFIDNALAGTLVPPLLLWDRREVEPLKVHPNEFFPEREMTLLDFQPKPLWPILRENYPENLETLDFIIGQLMTLSVQPLKKGLESLAPGAFEWMVDHCPLLTDPTQGGSFHPENIRVRMLTAGMLKQIIEAWIAWPFRPSRYELIARSGSDIHDPASVDEEL